MSSNKVSKAEREAMERFEATHKAAPLVGYRIRHEDQWRQYVDGAEKSRWNSSLKLNKRVFKNATSVDKNPELGGSEALKTNQVADDLLEGEAMQDADSTKGTVDMSSQLETTDSGLLYDRSDGAGKPITEENVGDGNGDDDMELDADDVMSYSKDKGESAKNVKGLPRALIPSKRSAPDGQEENKRHKA